MPWRPVPLMAVEARSEHRLRADRAGNVASVWGSVLGLALLAGLNPMRLGLALLMISRPRPGPNLLAYWAGGLTVCVPELLVPVSVLHFTPMFDFARHDKPTQTTHSTLAHIQIGIGAIGLTIAAVIAVRFLTRQREREPAGAATSTTTLDSALPMQRLLGRARAAPTEDESTMRRLARRARDAWDNGSLWVAWVIGLASVPVDGVLFMVAIIVASGASMATQLTAAVAFIVVMYAAVEVILIGFLATPARTQALLRLLHDWVRTYRRQILMVMFTVVGVSQLAQGMGG
ncbi:integral membrane protein [Mycobacterium rhizamassiliense]|uniref:Integral membrane protein n=1 Tax=Mycobacterium rhizamassiliense TaxID=1841860 RepID=A0A2U3NZH3_9MYCO|nr:integral membrane protein [Mycobacterium rhizamassiliense]